MRYLVRDDCGQRSGIVVIIGAQQRGTVEEDETSPGDAKGTVRIGLNEIDLACRVRAKVRTVVAQRAGSDIENLVVGRGSEIWRRPKVQACPVDVSAAGHLVVIRDHDEVTR